MLARFLSLALLVASVLLLAGCGGGGGGGGTAQGLAYTTDWSSRLNPGEITGLSQLVQLIGENGAVVASEVVNQDADGQQTTEIPVPDGSYRLLVTLFGGRNGEGGTVGTIDAKIAVSGRAAFATSVGEAVAGVRVTPSAQTVQVPQTARYHAAAVGASGRATFSLSSHFAWSVLGGVGAVDATGLFSAASAGTGSVRATHTPTAKLASAAITVTAPVVTTSKWTVLVYMNAANDLSQFDLLNYNQMERVAGNKDVRFVVQWKQAQAWWDPAPEFVGTRRYLVQADTTSQIKGAPVQDLGDSVDMGRPESLSQFVAWAKTNYPAQRYCLIVWNHGNGWKRDARPHYATRGVSYDWQSGNHIDTWQLAQAIGGTQWDVFAWDASLMQMLEVAYEVKDQAKYVVGSEESPPGEGLPYDLVFGPFKDNPTAPTATLAKAFVDGMLAVPAYQTRKITQSVLDTSKLVALRTAVSQLADALRARKAELATVIPAVRAAAKGFSVGPNRQFFDLYDVCDEIDARTTASDVRAATAAVRAAISQAVVWEGHTAASEGSHGVSIDFSSSETYLNTDAAETYPLLRFGKESSWIEWLKVAP